MKKILSLLSAIVITAVSFAGVSNADSKKPIVCLLYTSDAADE